MQRIETATCNNTMTQRHAAAKSFSHSNIPECSISTVQQQNPEATAIPEATINTTLQQLESAPHNSMNTRQQHAAATMCRQQHYAAAACISKGQCCAGTAIWRNSCSNSTYAAILNANQHVSIMYTFAWPISKAALMTRRYNAIMAQRCNATMAQSHSANDIA